jgi:polysaccharide biosynthesis transport protein
MDNNFLPNGLITEDKSIKPINEPELSYESGADKIQIRDYLSVVLKRKWWIISCVAAAFIFATYYNMTRVPIFRGTATLQIMQDNTSSLVSSDRKSDFDSAFSSTDKFYETQYKLLNSRAIAYRIIDSMNLMDHPQYKHIKDSNSQDSKRDLADEFTGQLRVSPVKNSYLVEISFESPDSKLAMQVPNAICREYLKFCMDTRSQSYSLIREWLENQLLKLAGKVESSEMKLFNHGRKEDFMALEGDDNVVVKKYVELNRVLTASQADRLTKESQYKQLQEKGMDAPLIAGNPLVVDLRKETITLEAKIRSEGKVYAKNHPVMLADTARLNELRGRLNGEVKRTVNAVKADYEIALRTENLLREAVDSQRKNVGKLQDHMIKYNILKRDMATSQQLYEALLSRMKEVSVTSTMVASNAVIIDAAELPLSPFMPRKSRNMNMALFFGLAGGIGLAFLMEHLDSSLKTVEELERFCRIPSLGVIPLSSKLPAAIGENVAVGLEIFNQPKSTVGEAVHHIQASVMLSMSGRPPKIIMVCSANPSEGKSSLSTALAASLAMRDHKVLLVDVDLRKPSLSKSFDVPELPGLSNFLSGGATLEEIIRPTKIPNLFLAPAGSVPPNPIPLLASQNFAELLKGLSNDYNSIIIDTPPVIGFADARMISPLVDGILVVFKHHATSREAARLAVQLLSKANARILGGVLNMVRRRKLGYGGYYYGYYKYSQYYKNYNND